MKKRKKCQFDIFILSQITLMCNDELEFLGKVHKRKIKHFEITNFRKITLFLYNT